MINKNRKYYFAILTLILHSAITNGQVILEDNYLIIHPNFDIADNRIITETTREILVVNSDTSIVESLKRQKATVMHKTIEGFDIKYKFLNLKLNSYNEDLNKLFANANTIALEQLDEPIIYIDKLGQQESLLHSNLSKQNLTVYEAVFIKNKEVMNLQFNSDSQRSNYNYIDLVKDRLKNRSFAKNDITELLFETTFIPGASFNKKMLLENDFCDTIRSGLDFIDRDLDLIIHKSQNIGATELTLECRKRFVIPEDIYPFTYEGKQIVHMVREENHFYTIDKKSGWPINKKVEINNVFNNRRSITLIETKYEQEQLEIDDLIQIMQQHGYRSTQYSPPNRIENTSKKN